MLMTKARELWDELRSVFSGRGVKIFDALVPVVVFLAANSGLGIELALGFSVGTSFLFFLYRFFKKENPYYALGGLGGVLLAAVFALVSDSSVGFFLPGLISSSLTVLLLLISAVIRRPLAALTSHLTRGWPLSWYWHARVRPAYSEVTLFWALGFGARLGLEYWFYKLEAVGGLGLVRTVMGWPYTILLLILSYLYGLWRLAKLGGPSVDEYRSGKEPPWEGQKRGF